MVCSGIFGFIYELLFYRIDLGYFVKRGSTYGPWIPIYVFGGLFIYLLTKKYKDKPIIVFLISLLVSGILEYFTGMFFYEILGKLYTMLIYIHPFREGNGRTVREFTREFSIAKSKELGLGNLELDWRLVDRDELDKYVDIAHMYPAMIGFILGKALVPVEDVNNRLK